MGSQFTATTNDGAPEAPLPDSSSETLVLTHPTDEEKRRTWTFNYREWGGALSLEQYLERERYGMTIPVARDGGMTHWILTAKPSPEVAAVGGGGGGGGGGGPPRPVLASCEAIRKRVLVARPSGNSVGGEGKDPVVEEAVSYGISSIYTYPEYRGRAYAGRMLKELVAVLKTQPQRERERGQQQRGKNEKQKGAVVVPEEEGERGNGETGEQRETQEGWKEKKVVCSALWSDIGKVFYAKKGWHPFPSVHVSFPAAAVSASNPAAAATVATTTGADLPTEPITFANLARFAALDEALLRRRLARAAARTGRPALAFAPDRDALCWHLYREAFIASRVLGEKNGGRDGKDAGAGGIAAATTPPTPSQASSTAPSSSREGRGGGGGYNEADEVEKGDDGIRGIAAGREGRRVWAVWARNYQAAPEAGGRAHNTLYILRLVVEGMDEDEEEGKGRAEGGEGEDEGGEELAEALAVVIDAARAEAARWGFGKVDLWNPTPLVRRLLDRKGAGAAAAGGMPCAWVDRDKDSIPSLMWYGDGDGDGDGEAEVEWLANEKYCWC